MGQMMTGFCLPATVHPQNDLIHLETGAPPFEVPEDLERAVNQAVALDEWTEYPPLHGLPALQEAIAAWHRDELCLDHTSENILITYGAMQAVFDVCTCELKAGDEVLLPAPYWFQFPQILKYTQADLTVIPTSPELDFKLTPEQLEQAITPRTRMLILTNPNNPTGSIYTKAEMDGLMAVMRAHPDILILSDEAYNMCLFQGQAGACAGPGRGDGLQDRVFIVNSLSKNFGLAGLRIGYLAGEKEAIARIGQRQRFATLGVNLRLQQVALNLWQDRTRIVSCLKEKLLARRAHAAELMREFPMFQVREPEAGYYYFADVSAWLGSYAPDGTAILTDEDLAAYLEKEAGVVVMTGTVCGMPGYLRMTFALPEDQFAQALERMSAPLRRLRLPN